jgi:SAM-dependent methyltransferase
MIVQACTSSHSSVEGSVRNQSREDARELIASSDFVWHQRFELEDGVYTPGTHDIEWLMDAAGVPRDLSRRAVLDVGTSNGGAAFGAERRGAERVVALDIYPPAWFGFDRLARFLDSGVEYVQGTVYELPRLVEGRFDEIFSSVSSITSAIRFWRSTPSARSPAMLPACMSRQRWRTLGFASKARPAWPVSTASTSWETTQAIGSFQASGRLRNGAHRPASR